MSLCFGLLEKTCGASRPKGFANEMMPILKPVGTDDAERLSCSGGDARVFEALYVHCLSTLETMIARDADSNEHAELSRNPSMQQMSPLDNEREQGYGPGAMHGTPKKMVDATSSTVDFNLHSVGSTGSIFPFSGTGYYPGSSLLQQAPVRKRNSRISLNNLLDFYVTNDLMVKSPKERSDYFLSAKA